MTEAPEKTEQTFKAKFHQTNVLMGGTALTMELDLVPAELGKWTASGTAHLGRGSTNPPLDLHFPMTGELTFNPTSEVVPTQYSLQVHSDFPDHRVGISLSVDLTAASSEPPSEAKHLEFTGEYTWLQGPPQTVTDAKFEMTNLGL
jgi:hypothetical protein